MLLSKLFEGEKKLDVRGLALDSRKVEPGDMFFCLPGYEKNGHDYADMAVDKGAEFIVHCEDIEKRPGITYIRVGDPRRELSRVCDIFYNYPSSKMLIFGTTGTNGKTTVSSIIREVFNHKMKCGYMGTLAVRYGDVDKLPNLTTPNQIEVHENLYDMAENGMEAAAIEVSSQGLATGRVDTVDFDCVIFTNLTHDHLDFHKTMGKYFEAKKLLFKRIKRSGIAVLNADDEPSIEGLKDCVNCRYVTYGTGRCGHADYMAKDIVFSNERTEFTLVNNNREYRIKSDLAAMFNVYNLLAAIAAMSECGMAIDQMIPHLENLKQVDGRVERIDEGQNFTVIVDFSHTPDGYEKMFAYAEDILCEGNNIYAVIGSNGKRDHAKRPEMGAIAAAHATEVVISTQDPRDEDPENIADEMILGMKGTDCRYSFVADREEAIRKCLSLPKAGDIVLLLGKGDEPYMYVGEGRIPYKGDHVIAHEALRKMAAK